MGRRPASSCLLIEVSERMCPVVELSNSHQAVPSELMSALLGLQNLLGALPPRRFEQVPPAPEGVVQLSPRLCEVAEADICAVPTIDHSHCLRCIFLGPPPRSNANGVQQKLLQGARKYEVHSDALTCSL